MTVPAPGKAHRKGMTLFEAYGRYATDELAEAWFIETCWSNGVACPKCGRLNVQERKSRKPLPRLPQGLLAQNRLEHGQFERPAAQVGYVLLPDVYAPQGRQLDETAPRPRRFAEDGLAHGTPYLGRVG